MVHREIAGCAACLARSLRMESHLFRPPRGEWNPTIYREARRNSDYIILWTVALDHHGITGPRAMAARVVRLVRPGGIVLVHDGGGVRSRDSTVRALPLLLTGLRKRGYRFATIPELLHVPGDEMLAATPDRKPTAVLSAVSASRVPALTMRAEGPDIP
jgi:chitin deacetylase